MAREIKSASEIAQKWADVTPGRRRYFLEGVERVKDWATPTKQSEERYETGIQDAIADKRFGRGVEKVGTKGWQEPTIEKGRLRWGPGVAGAEAKFKDRFAPFVDAIKELVETLPPRFARGSPENIKRVAHMAEGLRAKKLKLLEE